MQCDPHPLWVHRWSLVSSTIMCRNIRTLHNFQPPATTDEIQASSLQYVRKISGFTRPSQANEAVFARAVEEVVAATERLLQGLVTNSEPKDRDEEAAKGRARWQKRQARIAASVAE